MRAGLLKYLDTHERPMTTVLEVHVAKLVQIQVDVGSPSITARRLSEVRHVPSVAAPHLVLHVVRGEFTA